MTGRTQYIFFSGKGGVGKTTMACATTVHHARQGKKSLTITTDPASNLADVFETEIGHQIRPLGIPNPGVWRSIRIKQQRSIKRGF